MRYKTSLDKWAKVITISVAILYAFIIGLQFFIIREVVIAIPIVITVALLVVYFIAFALRPIEYSLTDKQLIIHRLFKDVKIDREQIRDVALLDKEKISWAIRNFGSGGLFGYFGKFSNKKLGGMTWFATRKDKTILVRTKNLQKIILTPDEPERLVSDYYA